MQPKRFTQEQYNRQLDSHNARHLGFLQSKCEGLLMEAGANREQAKNGAYVYLHHGACIYSSRRGSSEKYEQLLNDIGAKTKVPMDCIMHLENLGYGYRQAQSAVYNYRKRHGLIGHCETNNSRTQS